MLQICNKFVITHLQICYKFGRNYKNDLQICYKFVTAITTVDYKFVINFCNCNYKFVIKNIMKFIKIVKNQWVFDGFSKLQLQIYKFAITNL